MSDNVNQLLQRTYNIAGSNFQSGVAAGNFFLPGTINPGIEVGFPHPFFIKPDHNRGVLVEVTIPSGVTSGTITIPEGVKSKRVEFAPGCFGTQFDYSRALLFEFNQDVTVTFYSIDMYGFKSINQVPSTFVNDIYAGETTLGINILTAIEFSTTFTGGFTGTISLLNKFEMPFTDMRDIYNFDSLVGAPNTGGEPSPHVETNNLTAPYTFNYSLNYNGATWNTAPTITNCTPRPMVEIVQDNAQIDISNHQYIATQYVYPTYKANSGAVMTREQALDGTTSLGIVPYSDGWKGMYGNG